MFPWAVSDSRRADPVPFNLQDYFDLIDTTGRVVRADQRGAIAERQPTLLATLGLRLRNGLKP